MAKRLVRAVLFVLRLLTSCVWRRSVPMPARTHGGADRRPEQVQQATPAKCVPQQTEREARSVELVQTSQRNPVEWNAAPDVANPASPAGLPKNFATLSQLVDISAPRVALSEEVREVLLRRAMAADAPKWAPPSAHVLDYYARRAIARTPPCLPVPGFMHIQVTLPTAFVRGLVN